VVDVTDRRASCQQSFQDTVPNQHGFTGWHSLVVYALASPNTAFLAFFGQYGVVHHAEGVGQAGFQCVLRLLAAKHVWVKLAGADRITRASGRPEDAIPYMQALVAVAPGRLVWGSDWPHIGFHSRTKVHDDAILPYREVDVGRLLDVLTEAVPDAGTRRAILAENPARLYGFGL
jgi:predicted TIM-barrel fold metal-dependent hydrolase